jgi:hypothetical protein
MTRTMTERRRGAALLNVVVATACISFAFYFIVAGCAGAVESSRINACRANLSNLATAVILYDGRMGKIPGYMNCLADQQGNPFRDPDTKDPVPVSWAVELLADLDRAQVYELWRSSSGVAPGSKLNIYVEGLVCPNDERRADRTAAGLSYVANTGLPDLLQAKPPKNAADNGGVVSVGFPRDWQANGMFFDNYSDDKLIKPIAKERGPQIVMRLGGARDPKDKTLLFTENLDASNYVFDAKQKPASAEIGWGSVWAPGKSTPNPDAATHAKRGTMILEPRDDVSAPNAGIDAKTKLAGYQRCRPSSAHAGGFNAAFAARNVMFLKDTISYYIFARLMASDDALAKVPGTNTRVFPELKDQAPDIDLEP